MMRIEVAQDELFPMLCEEERADTVVVAVDGMKFRQRAWTRLKKGHVRCLKLH